MSQRVETIGQAISVLIQTANLAQSRGILSFEDAVIVKSAIDFVQDRIKESVANQPAVVSGSIETDEITQ